MSNSKKPTWDQFSQKFDFPPFERQPKVYVIASSGRSGSHFLANLLFQTRQMGCPLEYFHARHMERWQRKLDLYDPWSVLETLMRRRTSPSGWFGIKAHWSQFAPIVAKSAFLNRLNIQKYLRLSRRNVVAQAVSMEIARQSGAWISYQEEQCEPVYDFEGIFQAVRRLRLEDRHWELHFAQLEIMPLRLHYEDLAKSPISTVQQIGHHLGISNFEYQLDLQRAPQKQATQLNAEWEARFNREAAKLGCSEALAPLKPEHCSS